MSTNDRRPRRTDAAGPGVTPVVRTRQARGGDPNRPQPSVGRDSGGRKSSVGRSGRAGDQDAERGPDNRGTPRVRPSSTESSPNRERVASRSGSTPARRPEASTSPARGGTVRGAGDRADRSPPGRPASGSRTPLRSSTTPLSANAGRGRPGGADQTSTRPSVRTQEARRPSGRFQSEAARGSSRGDRPVGGDWASTPARHQADRAPGARAGDDRSTFGRGRPPVTGPGRFGSSPPRPDRPSRDSARAADS